MIENQNRNSFVVVEIIIIVVLKHHLYNWPYDVMRGILHRYHTALYTDWLTDWPLSDH